MGFGPVSPEHKVDWGPADRPRGPRAGGETPLWLYILKEAEVLQNGDRLGPVGGRRVGEVLVGIIDGDPESFRSVDPGWSPTLPGRRGGAFGLADILAPID